MITEDQRKLMDMCIECDGCEITEAWWEDALILAEKGYATLSSARGPNKAFRRLTPIMKPIYQKGVSK